MTLRIGQGLDVHRFAENRKCILAGVEIPCDKGLEGHSDADVAIHALIDALLGAASLGDIGHWFPDSDPKYAGINSLKLLVQVVEQVRQLGFDINNVDLTIIAEQPKIAPYTVQMRENLAKAMGVDKQLVNMKATTTEGLGFVGAKEGVAAMAVALLNYAPERVEESASKSKMDYHMLSGSTLAYIGDAVYELFVRKLLIDQGYTRGEDLQRLAKQYVSAAAQANRLREVEEALTEKELGVFRRGRNAKTGYTPKNADVIDYRYSTGLEALVGYLYLQDKWDRLKTILTKLTAVDLTE